MNSLLIYLLLGLGIEVVAESETPATVFHVGQTRCARKQESRASAVTEDVHNKYARRLAMPYNEGLIPVGHKSKSSIIAKTEHV